MTTTPHTPSPSVEEGWGEGIHSRVTALATAIAAALTLLLAACGGGAAQAHNFDLVVMHGEVTSGSNTFVYCHVLCPAAMATQIAGEINFISYFKAGNI